MNTTITLSQNALDVIQKALFQMPYGMAAPVVQEIGLQLPAPKPDATERTDKPGKDETNG